MIKFGTGGWRAIIGDEFTKENIQILTQAISDEMTTNKIVIGYDRRFLSDVAAEWMAEVFAANDIIVYFIPKAVPTPMTMFAVKKLGLEYGVAVTASHNPALYNGVKVFIEGGRDASQETTDLFQKRLADGLFVQSMDLEEAREQELVIDYDPKNDYIDAILAHVDEKAIRDANLKIMVDPMFGVSRTSLSIILNTLRCDVDMINERHDTLFGGKLPSPASANLIELENSVIDGNYDMGIATDGDADRIGIIDELGNFIHPNLLLSLLYFYLLEYKGLKGDVVRNLSTTHLLDRIAKDYGQKSIEVPVGFKHISENMEKHDALIGGESSGGLTIRGHIQGKDGIFAATLLVELVAISKETVSELVADLHERYGTLYNRESDYRFTDEDKVRINTTLFENKETPEFHLEVEKVSYMDGFKIYFTDGAWLSARFSGTEPLIRVFSEANSDEDVEKLVTTFEKFLDIESI